MPLNIIKNIRIIGLGALGAMYASKLQELDPDGLQIIVDERRKASYENKVFTVNGAEQNFSFVCPANHHPAADLIIIAVKFSSLDSAIRDITSFVGPDTIIISLLNGIGSEEQIGDALGGQHILHAYAVGMDAVRIETALSYSRIGKIVFGDKTAGPGSAKVAALAELFDRAQIPYSLPENIEHALWSKLMLNVGINQASTILSAPYAAFQGDTDARKLMVMAAKEVIAISAAAGIHLHFQDLENTFAVINTLSPEGKTSMLQDMEAGRKTEVDIFAGEVIRLGISYGIETPVNETFYRIIKFMEERKMTV